MDDVPTTSAPVTHPTLPLDELALPEVEELMPPPDEPQPAVFAEQLPGSPVFTVHPTPIGELLLTGDSRSLTGLYMLPDHRYGPAIGEDWRVSAEAFREIIEQLDAYFAGELHDFDVSLAPKGTPFQLAVWTTLTRVPYGHTVSYGSIAAALGRPTASRAVGMANGHNPISIVVPCHRVIGAGGSLTGYGGGLPRKRALLDLEGGGRLQSSRTRSRVLPGAVAATLLA